MYRLFSFAIIVSLTIPLPFEAALAAPGTVPVAEDGKRKINLSGRQRMLSQRMAKATCFAAAGVNTFQHMIQARDAYDLFDETLSALRHGDVELGMNPVTAPRILTELMMVEELWDSYGTLIRRSTSGLEEANSNLKLVAQLNMPVLRQMNRTVGEFERHYGGGGEIHHVLAHAINLSGRQRMLSQKASKEFCLIVAGHDVEKNRAALAQTTALFERSLNALLMGSDVLQMPPAPTDEIERQLEIVKGIWAPLKTIFEATTSGSQPSQAEITKVARDNNTLLREMNSAVGMYSAL